MPELPDVELFRRYLEDHALDRNIEKVVVNDETILHGISPATLRRRLKHSRVAKTMRHGKTLLAALDDGKGWLVLHFGMDGSLRYYEKDEERPRYERVRLELGNGRRLAYDSKRMLGDVNFTPDPSRWVKEHDLGPDALSVDEEAFVGLLRSRRGAVKTALTNQQLLAGVGNVYADEILFRARLHPQKPVNALEDKELRRLFRAMREVLNKSIDYGANPNRMPRSWLLSKREEGRPCPRCKTPLSKVKIAQRSTFLCPTCQPKNNK